MAARSAGATSRQQCIKFSTIANPCFMRAPFDLLVRCRMTLRAIAGPGNHRHKDAGDGWDYD